jgi:hypothetical protein
MLVSMLCHMQIIQFHAFLPFHPIHALYPYTSIINSLYQFNLSFIQLLLQSNTTHQLFSIILLFSFLSINSYLSSLSYNSFYILPYHSLKYSEQVQTQYNHPKITLAWQLL